VNGWAADEDFSSRSDAAAAKRRDLGLYHRAKDPHLKI